MPIQVAAHAGFCTGVSRAINQAAKVAQQAREEGFKAYSLGELIHNSGVVQSLKDQGLMPVNTPQEAKGGYLVIRSHGVSPEIIEECRLISEKVVDCTCIFVHHVHQLVLEFSQDGAPVIILGDPNHPEVMGIRGWCHGEHYVIHHASQIAQLPETASEALVVSQTTFPPSSWKELKEALENRFPRLHFKNTICRTTSLRQAEAEVLAKASDRMVVVGSKQSANTQKLVETCRKWCPETYLVDGVADLAGYPMNPAKEMIGITAGASTPAWSLKEVVDFMNDLELNGQVQNPDITKVLPENGEDAEQAVAVAVNEEAEPQALEETQQDISGSTHAAPVEEAAAETKAAPVEDAVVETKAVPVEEAAVETKAVPVEEAAVEAKAAPVEETAVETKAAPPAQAHAGAEKPQSFMDEVAANIARIRTGQTITGKIVQITDDEVCVNIGYKSDGLLKRDDMVDKDAKLGDEIEVEIVKVNDGEGNVILSQRNIVNRKVWGELMEKYGKGELVEGIGKEAVKGGLLANVDGVRAFIPASHLAQRYVEKISQFVGQPMKLKIIEVDEGKKRIVASRKEALAVESEEIKEAVWSKLEEGTLVKGIVRRFTSFGAFVDLGGVDGLIHVSDLSWNRAVTPSEVLEVNQEVEVKILSLDRERERIALGYKQLQPRPWDNIEEKYPVGTILTRKIVRVRPFGAFIELEPGVDGLVHISQVAHTRVEKIEDAVSPGQEVNVKVLAVDPDAKRISLSIREALEDNAMYYAADIPGENTETAHQDEDAVPMQQDAPAEEVKTDENEPETSLKRAMRKARVERDEQAAKPAEADEDGKEA